MNIICKYLYQKIFGLAALLIITLRLGAAPNDSISLSIMERTWQEFRAIHPYGFQTVALKHYGDTCVFIMSEPDSWVKECDLQLLFEKHNGQLILKYQPYGVDGQLTDAVGCAKLDTIMFDQFEKELFTLLYHTDYKPFYTNLDHPVEHTYFSKMRLDYQIKWEFLLSQRYLTQTRNDSILELDIPEIISLSNRQTNDIYFSRQRGSIVWIIDPNINYQSDSTFLVNTRRFSIDSDLILGTYRENNKIAIIGREREIPVTVLPPLRSSTILSLISNGDDLYLYFDRDSIKQINDTICAVPIKMSSMLNDTELGNLMVLTDIMLKSWSENGTVKDLFIDYPRPNGYPFPRGVANELGDSIKYLWNFTNVEVEIPGLLSAVRTGCLPPTYLSPSDSLAMNQNMMNIIAHDYFARLNCPDLVRVAQYAAIYYGFRGNCKAQIINNNSSWVQTPSTTISNIPWGFGGYLRQGKFPISRFGKNVLRKPSVPPVTIKKKLPEILVNNPRFKFTVQIVPGFKERLLNTPNLIQTFESVPKLIDKVSQYQFLAHRIAKDKTFAERLSDINFANEVVNNPFKYVLSVILSDRPIIKPVVPEGRMVGFNKEIHAQSISGDQILTESQVQEKVQERNTKLEMLKQIKKLGVSMKVLIEEKGNTVFIIIYSNKQRYDYAA